MDMLWYGLFWARLQHILHKRQPAHIQWYLQLIFQIYGSLEYQIQEFKETDRAFWVHGTFHYTDHKFAFPTTCNSSAATARSTIPCSGLPTTARNVSDIPQCISLRTQWILECHSFVLVCMLRVSLWRLCADLSGSVSTYMTSLFQNNGSPDFRRLPQLTNGPHTCHFLLTWNEEELHGGCRELRRLRSPGCTAFPSFYCNLESALEAPSRSLNLNDEWSSGWKTQVVPKKRTSERLAPTSSIWMFIFFFNLSLKAFRRSGKEL